MSIIKKEKERNERLMKIIDEHFIKMQDKETPEDFIRRIIHDNRLAMEQYLHVGRGDDYEKLINKAIFQKQISLDKKRMLFDNVASGHLITEFM